MSRYTVALLIVSCGGRLAPAELPPECVPPPLHCEWDAETAKVCTDGDQRWILYPSGETWRIVGFDVVCHIGPDGIIYVPKP